MFCHDKSRWTDKLKTIISISVRNSEKKKVGAKCRAQGCRIILYQSFCINSLCMTITHFFWGNLHRFWSDKNSSFLKNIFEKTGEWLTMKVTFISCWEFTFSVVESKGKLSVLSVCSPSWVTGVAAFVNCP